MKDPIQSRKLYFDRIRDGSIVFLDWCLVNTELGAMAEPRQVILFEPGGVTRNDAVDNSFSSFEEMNEDQMLDLIGVQGRQIPIDFNVP